MQSLDVRGLTKAWPDMAIHADLHVQAGTIACIVGPSGSGKSTLLRMITGLEKPDGGQVLVGGMDVTSLDPGKRGVGMVFQDHALFPHLDVAGNIAYGLTSSYRKHRHNMTDPDGERRDGNHDRRHDGILTGANSAGRPTRRPGRADIRATVERLLRSVDLEGFGTRMPHELSGGERQRVALARTLAVEPGVILFDEPLSSLDPSLRKRLRADIAAEQRRLGFTALYVTHDLEEALALADVLAIMIDGTIIQSGSPVELWTLPASTEVARFMGSGPVLPVFGYRQTGHGCVAITETGEFPLYPDPEVPSPEPCQTTNGVSDRSHSGVWFERNRARYVPESSGTSLEDATGWFGARVLDSDFAGDSVDCHLQAGTSVFTLRFDRGSAPAKGGHYLFRVDASGCRLLPSLLR